MSIKLINNNYEIIVASFADHIYIKTTNLINYSSYESKIYSYDITSECVKTIKNLWNIIVKAFLMIDKYEINILDPQIDKMESEYVVLKLLEQQNNIVLTICYNIALNFEFNITLNKIKSESSICDLTKIKYELESKDKQINELQKKLNNVFYFLSNRYKFDATVLEGKNEDISVYFNLKELSLCYNNQSSDKILISNTLEKLINNGFESSNNYCLFRFFDISKLPNLKCLQFNNCTNLCGPITYTQFISLLKEHPNKENIELILKNSPCFNITIEQYRSIGLKSVIVE